MQDVTLQHQIELIDLDASAIAEGIRNKTFSIATVVDAFIAQAETENARIHAIVEERFEEARKEAIEKDRLLTSSDNVGPLFGVPVTVKESFNVKGMKTTGGLVHRKDHVATDDATIIQQLKKAGAIILCKTNTPALCFCQETDNKLYGRTNNPWNLKRTAGGSSGGEGALLAVGGAAVGIGSDIGGSIRFPSHFNGVIGFKPGKKQVPSSGHFPEEADPLQQRMASYGPMGKSVRDMELVYSLIADYKPAKQLQEAVQIDCLPTPPPYPLSEETLQMMADVSSFAEQFGQVHQHSPPFFEDAAVIWQEIMSIGGAQSVKQLAFPGKRTPYIRSYLIEKLWKKSSVHTYLSWALIGATLFAPSKQRIQELASYFSQGDEVLYNYYEDRISILPIYHTGALPHGKVYNDIFSIRKTYKTYMPYVAYANVWGLPSLTIPISKNEEGMPMAVQLISRIGNEYLLFHIGKQFEKRFDGYQRSRSSSKV